MEFIYRFIDRIRIKLNRNIMRKSVVAALMVGALLGLLVVTISLFVPIYEKAVLITAIIPPVLSVPVGIFMGIKRRIDDKAAAVYIDGFGFKEKIITALENEKYKDPVILMQRQDAEAHLRAEGFKVNVKYEMPWLKLSVCFVAIILAIFLFLLPTNAKKVAADKHEAKVQAKQAEKEVQEMLEAMEEIDQSELSEAELAELQQMMESLEMSQNEFSQASSMEDFEKAKNKYDYKLGEASEKLGSLANGKSENTQKKIKSAQQIAENQNESEKQKQTAMNQNGENGENGQSGENGQNGESGQSGENGESGQSGEGQGEGSGQNGEGENGEGQTGQQSGNGSGSGQGQGGNSGMTSMQHNHDYVSVNQQVSGQYSDNTTSQYSHEQNGLTWEGTQVPYDTVVNEYSEQAYEGIDKGKYPGTMSNVIKEYFSGLSD